MEESKLPAVEHRRGDRVEVHVNDYVNGGSEWVPATVMYPFDPEDAKVQVRLDRHELAPEGGVVVWVNHRRVRPGPLVYTPGGSPAGTYTKDAIGADTKGVDGLLSALREEDVVDPTPHRYIDIVFDGPPGPEGPRLIETENEEGAGMYVGEWIERADGYWALRISR